MPLKLPGRSIRPREALSRRPAGRKRNTTAHVLPRLQADPGLNQQQDSGAANQDPVRLADCSRAGLLDFTAHSPEESRRYRKCRSARLQQTVPEGIVSVQNGGSGAALASVRNHTT